MTGQILFPLLFEEKQGNQIIVQVCADLFYPVVTFNFPQTKKSYILLVHYMEIYCIIFSFKTYAYPSNKFAKKIDSILGSKSKY